MRIRMFRIDAGTIDRPCVLDGLPAVIGSSPRSDLHISGANLAPHHCKLSVWEGHLIVHDLESEAGTFLNGVSVLQALVMPGDRLQLGDSRFIVSYEWIPATGPPDAIYKIDWPATTVAERGLPFRRFLCSGF